MDGNIKQMILIMYLCISLLVKYFKMYVRSMSNTQTHSHNHRVYTVIKPQIQNEQMRILH